MLKSPPENELGCCVITFSEKLTRFEHVTNKLYIPVKFLSFDYVYYINIKHWSLEKAKIFIVFLFHIVYDWGKNKIKRRAKSKFWKYSVHKFDCFLGEETICVKSRHLSIASTIQKKQSIEIPNRLKFPSTCMYIYLRSKNVRREIIHFGVI